MEVVMLAGLTVLLALLYAGVGLKKIGEHEQGVVLRFGRFMRVVPPGLQLIVPFVDELRRVDLRTLAVEERIDPSFGTGMVRMWDEPWPARSPDATVIGVGTPIRIVGMEGKYIVVAPTP